MPPSDFEALPRRRLFETIHHLAFERDWLFYALLAGLAAQAVLLAVLVPWERGSDSKEYLALANALDMGLYGSVTAAGFEPEALRPPAYPAVIWLLVELLGLPLGAVIGVQLLLYLCCLVALSRWLKVLRYGREAFLALNLIYVFPAIYISGIMTEA